MTTQRLAYVEAMIEELAALEDGDGYRTFTVDEVARNESGRIVTIFGTLDTWHSRYSDDRPIEEDDDLFRRGEAVPCIIGDPAGDDGYPSNLDRAIEIVERIRACDAVIAELKRTFGTRELEGGYKAAMTHPLWTQVGRERERLQESLTLLV